jgi:acetyltransferase
VAEGKQSDGQNPFILGIARLSKMLGGKEAEFAMVIGDAWQRRGLGKELLGRLIHVARDEKVERVFGTIMTENLEMRRLAEKLGFKLTSDMNDNTIHATLNTSSIPVPAGHD